MCTLCKHFHIFGVVLVNLARLKYLQTHGAVLVVGEERTASRLAHILHYSANAHRTVELLLQIDDEVGIFQLLDVSLAAAEVVLHEADDLFQLLVVVSACFECLEIVESLFLQGDEDAGDDLLVAHGVCLQTVGHHVVDILDEDDVGVDVVEILDERSVARANRQNCGMECCRD